MTGFDPNALVTGLILSDAEGTITRTNRAARELLDLPAARSAESRLADVSRELHGWLERSLATQRELYIPEAMLACHPHPLDVRIQPAGNGMLIELHPVAERVRQRELAERADRQQAVSMLARKLAHELRNPLAGVRGGAQLIAAADSSETVRRHAQMIQREVDRITRLIERFVQEGGGERLPVNLHRVIEEVLELVSAEAQGRLGLERDFDPSIPDITADAGQMHRLFLNLVRNALQAGATTIRIATRIEHQSPLLDQTGCHAIRIDVDDDGSGVPQALYDRLFLPLVSGRDSGTGFGLAIVQQIARAHGGLVEYLPLDGGSRFRLRLPLMAGRSKAA